MSKHTITCEATATIRETWAFELPEGWEAMDEDERYDAVSVAATDGDCLGDEVLGDEEGREWDLESIEPQGEDANEVEEIFTVVGTYSDAEEDGRPQRFGEEYASATGWEGAEAAALEEHPTLNIAAVIPGRVKCADAV